MKTKIYSTIDFASLYNALNTRSDMNKGTGDVISRFGRLQVTADIVKFARLDNDAAVGFLRVDLIGAEFPLAMLLLLSSAFHELVEDHRINDEDTGNGQQVEQEIGGEDQPESMNYRTGGELLVFGVRNNHNERPKRVGYHPKGGDHCIFEFSHAFANFERSHDLNVSVYGDDQRAKDADATCGRVRNQPDYTRQFSQWPVAECRIDREERH